MSVEIKVDDQVFRGRGVSTDVIEAAAEAYLSALNKTLVTRSVRPQEKVRTV